ncbi:MAG: DUF3987 domain-containing protein [Magnetococcales bacterium]|nr:DUF3987 domain-containing protein [Magnetococcales bacterium]
MNTNALKLAVQEAETYAKPIPLQTHSLPGWPKNLFPPWVEDMVQGVAATTETPVELAALFAMAVLGTCCQKTFSVRVKQDYFEPLNIWAAPSLGPGNRKTSVKKAMTADLLECERELAKSMEPLIKKATSDRKTQESIIASKRAQIGKQSNQAKVEELKKEISDLEAKLPEIPAPPQLWSQDITPERVGTVMADNKEKLALLSDEGGIFENMAGRYSGGIPNLDVFLQAHAGAEVRVDRGSRPPVYLHHPALTIGLSPQPDVLRDIAQKPGFRGRGLLARFLYALPSSPLGFRALESNPIAKPVKEAYRENIRALLKKKPGINKNDHEISHTIKMSRPAFGEWLAFSKTVEVDLREGGRFEMIQDWAGKLPGAAARIAGLLHCAEHADGQPQDIEISMETMSKALSIAAILAEHALAVFDLMGADPDLEGARRVWRWVERNRLERFSARDCFEGVKGHFKRMDALNPALEILVERHHLFKTEDDKRGPGRKTKEYVVHPVLVAEWN